MRYKDRAILYRNEGKGRFADISESAGEAIVERHSARGAAFGDYDNDGAVDVLVNNQNEAPSLMRQRERPAGNWIMLKLEGRRSNRSAIGARVTLTASGRKRTAEVRSGGSYLSQDDLRLHFGLGDSKVIDRLEIRWPAGAVQVVEAPAINRVTAIAEP